MYVRSSVTHRGLFSFSIGEAKRRGNKKHVAKCCRTCFNVKCCSALKKKKKLWKIDSENMFQNNIYARCVHATHTCALSRKVQNHNMLRSFILYYNIHTYVLCIRTDDTHTHMQITSSYASYTYSTIKKNLIYQLN